MTDEAQRIPLFPEWEQEHAQEIADAERTPERIQKMWRSFGRDNNATCGNCQHFQDFRYHNKHYFKCDLYGISHGAGTDWRKSWNACGKFVRSES